MPRARKTGAPRGGKKKIVGFIEEDGSFSASDGQVFDPDTKRWRDPLPPKSRPKKRPA